RLITEHLTRLERQLDDTRSAVTALRRLLDPTPPAIDVRRVLAEPFSVAAISEVVDEPDVLPWYSDAMAEL
ncbi:MerR family transcriptional regulator, partial [Rhodococcus ruber]|nr:MerR family transcriptional regulator [Rhodococcus ruber]